MWRPKHIPRERLQHSAITRNKSNTIKINKSKDIISNNSTTKGLLKNSGEAFVETFSNEEKKRAKQIELTNNNSVNYSKSNSE